MDKKILLETLINEPYLAKIREQFKLKMAGKIETMTLGIDLVGYETIIDFIDTHQILAREGNLVEIGALFGGGTYKLSQMLEKNQSDKKIYVIDIFEPSTDLSQNNLGLNMASIYQRYLTAFEGKNQWEVFCEITRSCQNLIVLKQDSKKVKIQDKICFAFIDGNHHSDYIVNDFYLVWNKLSQGAWLCFDDYGSDLQEVTRTVDFLLKKHKTQISNTHHHKKENLFFLQKKAI